MKSDKEILLELIKQIQSGLSLIMEQSYPNCKHLDPEVSSSNSKINNTAFELKRTAVLLQNQFSINE